MSDLEKSIIAMMKAPPKCANPSTSTFAAATTGPETLTTEELAGQINRIEAAMRRFQRSAAQASDGMTSFVGSAFGLPIHESYMATRSRPARVHVQRRGQTMRYHLRIQKKWNKRFGFVSTPGAYMIDGSVIGQRGKMLMVHPTIAAKLRGNWFL